MPTYIYGAEETRYYPYPPLIRQFAPGDEIDLPADQVPRDGRFWLKDPDGKRLPLPDLQPPPAPADASPESPSATKATKPAAKPKEQ